MQTSKKILIFGAIMYAATWVVAVFSWFQTREIPEELFYFATVLYSIEFVTYCCCTTYKSKEH